MAEPTEEELIAERLCGTWSGVVAGVKCKRCIEYERPEHVALRAELGILERNELDRHRLWETG